jgi:hypothetical protein
LAPADFCCSQAWNPLWKVADFRRQKRNEMIRYVTYALSRKTNSRTGRRFGSGV